MAKTFVHAVTLPGGFCINVAALLVTMLESAAVHSSAVVLPSRVHSTCAKKAACMCVADKQQAYLCALLNGVLNSMLYIQAACAAAEVHVEGNVGAAEA